MIKHFLLITISVAFVSQVANAQNINTVTNFPDPNFRAVVEATMGIGPGGSFTAAQAAAYSGHMSALRSNISDLTGIEYFTNLDTLYAHFNNLTTVDLSSNTTLRRLFLSYNGITSLDLSANVNLEEIYCQSNELTSLTLPASAPIQVLLVHYNHLTDVSNILSLTNLDSGDLINISYNNLDVNDSADVIALRDLLGSNLTYTPQRGIPDYQPIPASENINTVTAIPDPAFRTVVQGIFGAAPSDIITATDAAAVTGHISAQNRGITDLTGIEYFTGIETLYAQLNSISSIDLSQNVALQRLFLSYNNLTTVDLSNNNQLREIYLQVNQLTSVTWPVSAPVQRVLVHYNYLENVSNFTTMTNLESGDLVNIAYNRLDVNDSPDVNALISLLDSGLTYSPQRGIPNYQPIPDEANINTASAIPDPVFRGIVQSLFNAAPGDVISVTQAASYTGHISAQNRGISDLTGIEHFTNLDTLYAHMNSLTSVDLSGNTALRRLFIGYNQLTSLDLSANVNLVEVYAQSNYMTSLALPESAPLNRILVHYNDLPDVSNFLALNNLASGDLVNISYNYLDVHDSGTVNALISLLGSGLTYSPQRGIPDYQPVPDESNINTQERIPDANFRTIVQGLFNAAPADIITTTQAASFTGHIWAHNSGIQDLTGIEYFTGIDTLYAHYNNLSSIDLSLNTALERVFLNYNQLSSLDVSALTGLTQLYAQGNQLVSVNLPANPPLSNIGLHFNQLNDIQFLADLPGLASVSTLDVRNNILTENDLSAISTIESAIGTGFSYTIIDTLPPSIECLDPIIAEAQQAGGAVVAFQTPTITDLIDSAPTVEIVPPSGSLFPIGSTIVSVTATDAAGHVALCTFPVTVQDTVAPALTCPDPITVSAQGAGGTQVSYSAPSASDAVDPSPAVQASPASGSLFPIGVTVVNVTATDSYGNQSTCSFTIEIVDQTPPVISLGGPSELRLECNVDSYDPNVWLASALDDIDGAVAVQVGGDVVDAASLGTYTLTFDAVDGAGNSAAQLTRQVIVEDTTDPVISGTQNIVQNQSAGCPPQTSVVMSGISVLDVCDPAPSITTTVTFPDGSITQKSGLPAALESFPLGVSTIRIDAIDASGNSAFAEFTVTIQPISFINALAISIQSGSIQYVTNTNVYVYDLTSGSCADSVDGQANEAVPNNLYDDVFQTCQPDFTGTLDGDGMVDIGVYADTPYLVLLWIDDDNDGLVSSSDRFVGRKVSGVDCGTTLNTYLIDFHYVLFALNSLYLEESSQVSGDVAAEDAVPDMHLSDNAEIAIDKRVQLLGDIFGDTVSIKPFASIIGDIFTNELKAGPNVSVQGSIIKSLFLKLANPIQESLAPTPGTLDINVNGGGSMTLNAGSYKAITLNQGSASSPTTLILNGGVYEFESLSTGSNCRIECVGPVEIRINGNVDIGANNYIGPQTSAPICSRDIDIYVNAVNTSQRDKTKAFFTGASTEIRARIYSPNGMIQMADDCIGKGRFIGKWLQAGKRSKIDKD